jgi:hypothetical protein
MSQVPPLVVLLGLTLSFFSSRETMAQQFDENGVVYEAARNKVGLIRYCRKNQLLDQAVADQAITAVEARLRQLPPGNGSSTEQGDRAQQAGEDGFWEVDRRRDIVGVASLFRTTPADLCKEWADDTLRAQEREIDNTTIAEAEPARIAPNDKPTLVDTPRDKPLIIETRRDKPLVIETQRDKPLIIEAQRDKPPVVEAQRDKPAVIEAQRDKPPVVEAQRDKPAVTEAQRDKPAVTEAQRDNPAVIEAQRDKPAVVEAQRDKPAVTETQRDKPAARDIPPVRSPAAQRVARSMPRPPLPEKAPFLKTKAELASLQPSSLANARIAASTGRAVPGPVSSVLVVAPASAPQSIGQAAPGPASLSGKAAEPLPPEQTALAEAPTSRRDDQPSSLWGKWPFDGARKRERCWMPGCKWSTPQERRSWGY